MQHTKLFLSHHAVLFKQPSILARGVPTDVGSNTVVFTVRMISHGGSFMDGSAQLETKLGLPLGFIDVSVGLYSINCRR